MRIRVRHLTDYRYSAPVRLGTQRLRLLPRGDGVEVIEARILINPEPCARQESIDPHGNRVVDAAFDAETDRFVVESRFEVATPKLAPAPTTPLPQLPWDPASLNGHASYFDHSNLDETVRAFAAEIATQSDGEAEVFLARLNETLFSRTNRYIRGSGYAQTPAETLALGAGACRDITVLFMAAARAQGIASRFVSGYQARAATPDGLRHLHAWPEVLLPGTGWRGFDPTHGLPTLDGHVAVCAGPDQRSTMPIEGGFFGTGISSTLKYEVSIEVDD